MAVEVDDEAMEAYLEGNEPDEAKLKQLIRKGTINSNFYPRVLRLRLQEQRRAAATRRRARLFAVSGRHSAD